MDERTQRAIETATQRARVLLEHDFSEQLEATFDILRDGTISEADDPHPRAHERARIVASIEHKRAAGMSSKASVADYVRDAAFTFLNRIVALKMLEARGLVRECVSRGEQSAGYVQEFCGMAPGIALLKSAGYRLYLESLFDELATEVKVLFDRRDPASVLWPRLGAFDDLVTELNATELAAAWSEDETIGWVYQYFNSDTERREMRDASPAPRNSRELAIRNQFFTPAYVVRFLADNTLGRLWNEMHPETRLVERCAYLVPTAVPSAPLRDPRDLRILDPACGSGHFLLYAFDLLLEIYEEAWALEGGPRWSSTSRTLREDYPDRVALRRAIPELILRHNLHGVDIDARCAQIAQLALWMRAQRAYERLEVERRDRPRIRKVSIVVAEPMPGPRAELDDFVRGLEDPVLRDLFVRLVDRLELAGELGLMLKFEDLLPSAKPGQTNLFRVAEERLMAAVVAYAGRVTVQDNARRRIFADDAVQGLGLLELANTRFDVILMNPPFGERPAGANEYLTSTYARTAVDLFSVFFERTFQLLKPGGRVGVISNRTWMSLTSFEALRTEILGTVACVEIAADLGSFVLEAQVETAAIVFKLGLAPSVEAPWIRLLKTKAKEETLRQVLQSLRTRGSHRSLFAASHDKFNALPSCFFAYWMSATLTALYSSRRTFATSGHAVVVGTQTSDDFRFLRLGWEVPQGEIGLALSWAPFAKGGEYSPYYDDIHLTVRWEGAGHEIEAFPKAFIRSPQYYGRSGVTWPARTTSPFGPRVLPSGCAFGHKGPAAIPGEPAETAVVLGCLASRPMRLLLSARLGAGDDAPGSASKSYEVGLIRDLPMPPLSAGQLASLAELTTRAIQLASTEFRFVDEAAAVFTLPEPIFVAVGNRALGFDDLVARTIASREDRFVEMAAIQQQIDDLVAGGLGFTEADLQVLNEELELGLQQLPRDAVVNDDLFRTAYLTKNAVPGERLPGGVIAEQDVRIRTRRAKQHAALRSEQALARLFEAHPAVVVTARRALGLVRKEDREGRARDVVSFLAGVAFGRFLPASCLRAAEESLDPFAELPRPLHLGGNPRAIVVDDEGHRDDLAAMILTAARDLLGEDSRVLDEAIVHLGADGLRGWLRAGFFDDHLARYSKSRRKAPLYWWLSTPSASYSVWLYVHGLTSDTLYAVQSKYVEPKLERERLALTRQQKDAGANPAAAVRAQLEKQENLVKELQEFLADLKHVAALWRPTLDDGIVIAQAPLWRLVRHAAWRKELESTWEALGNREYDWAHLAMHLWPEEVIPKCAKDRSLAIAHGLEDMFWTENGAKWAPRRAPTASIDDLVHARSSPAVKAALAHAAVTPAERSDGNGRKSSATPKRPRKRKT